MSDYIAHSLERNGWKLEVVPDDNESFGNPYKEYDQLTDCVTWLHRYDFDSTKRKPYDSPDEVVEAYQRGELVYYAPLYAYIHSGITVSLGRDKYPFNDVWDSGLAGMIYVTREKARKEFPNLRNRTLWLACARVAKGEVKSLDDWLTGNIWGYRITDPEGEEVDSCWGFLGDSEYCFEEGKSQLDYYVKQDNERLAEQSQGAWMGLESLPLFGIEEVYGV